MQLIFECVVVVVEEEGKTMQGLRNHFQKHILIDWWWWW